MYHAHGDSADTGIQKAGAGAGCYFALKVVGSLPRHTVVLYLFSAK